MIFPRQAFGQSFKTYGSFLAVKGHLKLRVAHFLIADVKRGIGIILDVISLHVLRAYELVIALSIIPTNAD